MKKILLSLIVLLPTLASAAPPVPEPLEPWVPWTLASHPDQGCAWWGQDRICHWPGSLELALDDSGGRFRLAVTGDAEGVVLLPGDATRWPRDVRLDGEPALMVRAGEGRPALKVPPGQHVVAGSFRWSRLPESLPVPSTIALLDLRVRGRAVAWPRREHGGMPWLQGGAQEAAAEDRVALEVNRRIVDGVPVVVDTRIKLRVSGKSREVDLGEPVGGELETVSLVSSLPARLDPEGHLHVQLRPGDWQLDVKARSEGPVSQLPLVERPAPWPAEEHWVFQASPSTRSVRLEGVPGVDPQHTSLPDDWRSLPAFRVAQGAALELVELRRGEAQPPPDDVTVQRAFWLEEDGSGYTVRDRLRGQLFQGGRLELTAGELGRVSSGGEDQLISRSRDGQRSGVELRDGTLSVEAVLTYAGAGAKVPAVGWDRDARSLSGELMLPPGWLLLAAPGVDRAGGTWLDSWTLLDLFFLLLVVFALWKLESPLWAAVALVTLGLAWHEREAPQIGWLVVMGATALLRVLDAGRLRSAMRALRWVALGVLAVQVLVFSWRQTRTAFFPQLAGGAADPLEGGYRYDAGGGGDMDFGVANNAPMEIQQLEKSAVMEEEAWKQDAAPPPISKRSRGRADLSSLVGSSSAVQYDKPMKKRAAWQDPKAVVQTGPGLPGWSWSRVPLTWNGPVSAEHELSFVLVPPVINALLSLLRVAGVIALLLLVGGGRWSRFRVPAAPAAALLALLAVPTAQASDLPDQALLNQLEQRLTQQPACLPSCVEVSQMKLRADDSGLRVTAELHAQTLTAWRLPGPDSAWAPAEVLLDGRRVHALRRDDDGHLALRVAPGVHRVELSGPARESLTLRFDVVPRVLLWEGDGWTIDGWRPDTEPPASVQLARQRVIEEEAAEEQQVSLAPWLELRRELDIGVPWLVHNELRRLGPSEASVLARVPLLAGESVTTPGVTVEAGEALVALEPDESVRSWESTLAEADTLQLTAPRDRPWTERWVLTCSPVWDCSYDGLAPTRHMDGARWSPQWQPWPGESLALSFVRPVAAEGQSTTIDAATLELRPGERIIEATLSLDLRSSQGGPQQVQLPDSAKLQSLRVDGQGRPFQVEGQQVRYSIEPGKHSAELRWRLDSSTGLSLGTPELDLGQPSANVKLVVEVPENRWVLWTGGPSWGPVVTLWQYVLVLLLTALLLGRLAPVPLHTVDWFLLGLGMTQVPLGAPVIVVLWLLMLGLRSRWQAQRWYSHDLAQLALIGLTVLALGMLFWAIEQGLVVQPDMQVEGGGSYGNQLQWYVARAGSTLPSAWLLWLPRWTFHVVMLLWALWLVGRLIKLARWAWEQFVVEGLWRRPVRKAMPAAVGVAAAGGDEATGEVSSAVRVDPPKVDND